MREIKFRAYNHRIEEMEKVNSIDWLWNEDTEKYEPDVITREARLSDELSLMQFTGLKDKNGVEIYEGDIIELKHPYKGRYHKGVVEFIGWRWTMRNFFQGQLDIPNEPFSEGTEYIEVIGNIYESKDLLQ